MSAQATYECRDYVEEDGLTKCAAQVAYGKSFLTQCSIPWYSYRIALMTLGMKFGNTELHNRACGIALNKLVMRRISRSGRK